MKSPSGKTKIGQQGYAMAMVLALLIILSIMGSGILAMSTNEGMLTNQMILKRQALYLAEAGSQRLIARLAKSSDWSSVAPLSGSQLQGPGTYDASFSGNNTSGIITATGTYQSEKCTIKVTITR